MSARNARSTRPAVLCDEKDANRYVSRIIPWVLLGIIGYASYVVTKPLCIDYLIYPQSQYARKPRIGAGVAIIVLFYVLLFPVIVTYLRLYYIVAFNPDFLPRGAGWNPSKSEENETKSHARSRRRKRRLSNQDEVSGSYSNGNGGGGGHDNNREKRRRHSTTTATQATDVEQRGGVAFPLNDLSQETFWKKDIFICQDDGRPAYCSKCCQFKTDRSHHNRDFDRCVRKLDHFCPWVGGVVSESSYKFFLQFVFYTAFFTCFALIVFAIFIAELHSDSGTVNAHWAVGLGLAGLFFLFSAGMSGTSLQLTAINVTTIENLTRRSKIWTLAIYIPPHQLERISRPDGNNSQWAQTFPTVTYPLQKSPYPPPADSKKSVDNSPPPNDHSVPAAKPNGDVSKYNTRTFAILRTQPAENPFDLGDPIRNIQQVMGYTLWDWLLPLKVAPCVDHTSQESAYPMGPVVDRLKREAGISAAPSDGVLEEDGLEKRTHRKKRRHHRRWHREETGGRGDDSSSRRSEEG
ncbi:DHHC zinc finger membrane protein [Talaromyces proteolyticus]|uniref:Palmitoyltransferase n=1 Tax=Talaromyces proteolyticus TaxID=1131652 RepID=A0AAD4L1X6_9EURO|nr:DHHC zinc finger membrane protein [Talaromyces proteolyticus]KAH8701729.1 DHHC zinc finger membrane protein [Talaromyces proteolyticus]